MVRRYVPGPSLDEVPVVYAGASGAARSWVYADRLGSTVALADGSGAASAIHTYGPFGEPGETAAGADAAMPLRYTGRPLDPDTGLYYYRARWYSPYLGRFLTRDPIGIGDGLHTYAYAGNDPINFTDPSGECALAGAAVGGGLELGSQLFNRKDRAAWGKAWTRFKGGDLSGAWGTARGQIGRVAEGAVVGGVTCGVGGAAASGGAKVLKNASTASRIRRATENAAEEVPEVVLSREALAKAGRSGRQARLRELAQDPQVSSATGAGFGRK